MLKHVQKNWKPIVSTFVIYMCWIIISFLFIVALQGKDLTIRQFGGDRLLLFLTHSIIKGTFVFYILIFILLIPTIEAQSWKKGIFRIIIFFILLCIYECIWAFNIENTAQFEGKNFVLRTFLLTIIMLDFLILLVAIVVAVIYTSNKMRKRKNELEKQKLEAELAAVKYQINPHFLFNSLSFIYTKIVRQDTETAHAVQLLSEIMSYALDDWGKLGTVPLRLEIDQMKKVIEMNQIRFSHQLPIQYVENIEPVEMQIPIFSLVTLIENAFKHGDLTDENNKLTIEINVTKNSFHFLIHNKKKNGTKELSKGIGIANVQQRLTLMYGAKYSFVIKENDNFYRNEITINP